MTHEQLKQWRNRLNLTQKQAASLLKVTLAGYQHWEYGRRPIPGMAADVCAVIEEPALAARIWRITDRPSHPPPP